MTRAPVILFYVQHLLGIGHLARASRIAAALAARGAEVTVVTGGLPVAGFPAPGVRHVALPPVQTADGEFSGLADANGQPADAGFLNARRDLLLQIFHDLAPDAVITEAFPFGRRQMRFELLPLIEAVEHARPRPALICSVRDILQEKVKPGRNEEMAALVRAHYDLVMVHGDPAFAPFSDSFPLAAIISDLIVHTGLVAPPPVEPAADHYDIVVSAGGGAVGAGLVRAAMGAARKLPGDLRWCVITGPNLAYEEQMNIAAEASDNMDIFAFRRDFPALLAAARLSVSQAGYNTVCDVLRAGCRSVLVPYAEGGETEQTTRATKLAATGRAVVITEADLTPRALAGAIQATLLASRAGLSPLSLDGAGRSAELVYDLIDRRSAGAR